MHDMARMLEEIMEVQFGVIDLNLYLNTHPRDQVALTRRNELLEETKRREAAYEARYGMLTPQTVATYPWQWIDEPWPWEVSFR